MNNNAVNTPILLLIGYILLGTAQVIFMRYADLHLGWIDGIFIQVITVIWPNLIKACITFIAAFTSTTALSNNKYPSKRLGVAITALSVAAVINAFAVVIQLAPDSSGLS